VPRMLNGCYKHGVPTGRFPRSTIVLQTFRPAGTVSYVLRLCYKHSVPTGRSPDVERIFYKHSVPLGRFPRLYDCATNVPSLWDGFLFDDCATQLVPLGPVGETDRVLPELKFGGHP